MADRAGGGTSLRGMRERMVAAAHAIAAERRSHSTLPTVAQQTATTSVKSTCKPILDGSVLKNDEKQRLAKERREEKRRRDDANKETQLLEKERKAKIYQEKQTEEKQRKLKEQKERDEQRRMSVEEKRKQKLEEEQERYKAVLSRTVERSTSRADSKKRWSWEGPLGEGKSAAESKDGKMGWRSSSLNRKSTQIQPSSDKNQLDGRPPGPHTLVHHMARSNRSQSTHELHPVIVIPTPSLLESGTSDAYDQKPISKSTKVLHNKNGRKAPRKSRGQELVKGALHPPIKVTISRKMEVATKVSRPSLPAIELKRECPNPDGHMTSSADRIVSETGMEGCPGASAESSLGDSLDTSPEVSTESSSAFSVNPSPEVSIDSSGDRSVDTSPEVSVELSPEAGLVEVPPGVKVEVLLEHPIELPCVQYVEQMKQLSEPATDGIAGPSSDMKNTRQKKMTSAHLTKKQLASNIPCYTWPSLPSSVSRPPSPRLNKPKCLPSPVISKAPGQLSLAYKVTPVQRLLKEDNVINTNEKKKDVAPKPAIVSEDLGNKTTPGIVNKEEATKMLSEKRRIVREQREKELQKDEVEEERKCKDLESHREDIPSRSDEGQLQATDDTDLQNFEGGQLKQEFAKTTGYTEPDNQKKGDAKIKAQEEADKRKKEHERIMLQNLKERLERKKRIEEIMKRTRKTDWNPAKAAETMGKAEEADDEDEADDEEESDSEKDLSDDTNSSVSSEESSLKSQMPFQNTKKSTKLVFLDPTSTQLHPGTRVFLDCGVKSAQPMSSKGAVAMTKETRALSKRATGRPNKSKSLEANKSPEASKSVPTPGQEWYCSTVIDMSNDSESILRRAAHIKKYHPRGSLAACPNPPADEKSTAPLDK